MFFGFYKYIFLAASSSSRSQFVCQSVSVSVGRLVDFVKKLPLEYQILTKTYLPTYLCDSIGGSDSSDRSNSSDSSDQQNKFTTKKTFLPTKNYKPKFHKKKKIYQKVKSCQKWEIINLKKFKASKCEKTHELKLWQNS